MDLADQVRAALADDLGAVLVAEIVALDVEVARLHLGPHRAVAEHDAIGEVVEEMGHRGWLCTKAQVGGATIGTSRRPPLTLPSPPASGGEGGFGE